MANLSITAANVVPVDDADNEFEAGTSGATVTAGAALYFDETDSKYKLCDNDSATAAVRTFRGIALNGASDGQRIDVQTAGLINLGATLAVGTIYLTSSTAGAIMPHGDLATGDYTSIIGVGITAANLRMVGHGSRNTAFRGGFNSGAVVP